MRAPYASRYFVDGREWYICPLCTRGFAPECLKLDVLTLEHAPPKNLGGSQIALTCKDCNNMAGAEVDHNMVKFETIFDFAHGTMKRAVPIQFEHGGIAVNAELLAAAEEVSVYGLPGNNPPHTIRDSEAELDRVVRESDWTDYKIRINFTQRFDHRAALVGWLRSAYLVAFAAFGYSYIIRPSMVVVRQQIGAPKDVIIPIFSATDGAESDSQVRFIMLVRKPEEMQCVLVKMGRHSIFLPPLEDRGSFYEQFSTVSRDIRLPHAMSGKRVPWPAGPTHLLD